MSTTITTLEGGKFEPRDLRAATEDIDLEKIAPGMYRANGEYDLDLEQRSCLCPDNEYRGIRCKHQRKAEMLEGDREIPPIPEADLDEDLRKKLEEAEQADEVDEEVPITDGGVTSTGPHIPSEETSELDLDANADGGISLREIVGEQTTTIEDLPDFGYDEPAGWNGEPYSSIVGFAYDSVKRLVAEETTTTTPTDTNTEATDE